MDGTEPPADETFGPTVKQVAMSVEHPFLLQLDSESIRIFLRKYDVYTREVHARASQLVGGGAASLEPVNPVSLLYCVHAEQLESAIECDLVDGCKDVDELTNAVLRTFLDKETEESKDIISKADLTATVQATLRMKMSLRSAKERMKLLFMEYRSLLRTNGIKWVTTKTPKVAIKHILLAVRPALLRTRLEQDPAFSHHHLKADFGGFMVHALQVSEAFEKFDNGPLRSHKCDRDVERIKSTHVGSSSSSSKAGHKANAQSKREKRGKKQPSTPCPLPKCKGKNRFRWIVDCHDSTDEEKRRFKEDLAAAKVRDGPAYSTRSRVKSAHGSQRTVNGLHNRSRDIGESPSCRMTVSDVTSSLDIVGRCDDGSDENIANPTIAEKAVLQGVGSMQLIRKVRLKVALTKEGESAECTFSRARTVPSTVLHLSVGQLALKNIKFLVPDDEVESEDLHIGLPVLRHLRVDTKTLLEDNIELLNGTDCSLEDSQRREPGKLGRIMVARLIRHMEQLPVKRPAANPSRPKINYQIARQEEDPFPDPSLLDPIDENQHEAIRSATDEMLRSAKTSDLSHNDHKDVRKIVFDHMDIFRCSFSAGPPARLPPLNIELTHDAKPVKVRLRKYSADQRKFLARFVKSLVKIGMAYPNPASRWACAPLLVPKPEAEYRFTSDLRPVNMLTIKHQLLMPNIEHELDSLRRSKVFASVDMSHSYWQLALAPESQECQSIITPDGIFTMNRVSHGTTNDVTHLQSSLAAIIPEELKANILIWLDDILIHAATVARLRDSIATFFFLSLRGL